jgi:adenylylsulfate kinase
MIHPKTLWFTGLSGSGKSTLAEAVKNKLVEMGHLIKILDGDEIRKGLNKNLSFSIEDRFENIRRVAEVNNLFLDFGISTINAFISPTDEIRKMAKMIIGENRFFEIYLTTPLDVCIKRDPKGFYKKVKAGNLKNFTGVDSVFEPSTSASLYLDTSQIPLHECIELILSVFNQPQTSALELTKSNYQHIPNECQ